MKIKTSGDGGNINTFFLRKKELYIYMTYRTGVAWAATLLPKSLKQFQALAVRFKKLKL